MRLFDAIVHRPLHQLACVKKKTIRILQGLLAGTSIWNQMTLPIIQILGLLIDSGLVHAAASFINHINFNVNANASKRLD